MDHDCLEHLVYSECESIEPHGEHHLDVRWTCSVCGEWFTGSELDVYVSGAGLL